MYLEYNSNYANYVSIASHAKTFIISLLIWFAPYGRCVIAERKGDGCPASSFISGHFDEVILSQVQCSALHPVRRAAVAV